jgi:hypothetical protein
MSGAEGSSSASRVGELIADRFELLERLGGGAYATVYRALDRGLFGRVEVAVKLLEPEHRADAETLDRFVAEARRLMSLSSPNVVRAYDLCLDGDDALYAMDLLSGRSLEAALLEAAAQSAPPDGAWVGEVLSGVAAGLDALHAQGLTHRDLKPANVMLADERGCLVPKLVDLGLARDVTTSVGDATTVGRFLGSYAYATPEQALGQPYVGASDQFALATIAFELLTLHRPFVREASGRCARYGARAPKEATPAGVLRAIARGARPSAAAYRPELGELIDAALERAWSTTPAARFERCAAFVAALADRGAYTWVSGPPSAVLRADAVDGTEMTALRTHDTRVGPEPTAATFAEPIILGTPMVAAAAPPPSARPWAPRRVAPAVVVFAGAALALAAVAVAVLLSSSPQVLRLAPPAAPGAIVGDGDGVGVEAVEAVAASPAPSATPSAPPVPARPVARAIERAIERAAPRASQDSDPRRGRGTAPPPSASPARDGTPRSRALVALRHTLDGIAGAGSLSTDDAQRLADLADAAIQELPEARRGHFARLRLEAFAARQRRPFEALVAELEREPAQP